MLTLPNESELPLYKAPKLLRDFQGVFRGCIYTISTAVVVNQVMPRNLPEPPAAKRLIFTGSILRARVHTSCTQKLPYSP